MTKDISGLIGKAYRETKRLLIDEFNVLIWLKLALVFTLFAGVGLGINSDSLQDAIKQGTFQKESMIVFAVVLAVVLMVSLVSTYISAISGFVIIKALVTKKISVVDDYANQGGNGLIIFMIEIGTSILMFLLMMVAMIILLIIESTLGSIPMILFMLLTFALFLLLLLVIFAGFWTLHNLVVPIMFIRNKGLKDALTRVQDILSRELGSVVVFSIVYFAITILAVLLVFGFALIFFIVLFIGFELLGLGVDWLAGLDVTKLQPGSYHIAIGIMFGASLFELIVTFFITVLFLPLDVFLKYFNLCFLDQVDPKLNLLGKHQKNKTRESPTEGFDQMEKIKVY